MSPEIEAAITLAAQEQGIDPAFALAVAERESNGNPNAHTSRSIYGLFQMTGDLRHRYGAGDSDDPYTQAQSWARFIGAAKDSLAQRLGRDPTNEELYLAHHFGEGRAAGMIGGQIGGSTPVSDVFTPYERGLNPHFDRAGTVGNLTSSINADIAQRMQRYGGPSGAPGIDFASFGQAVEGQSGQNPAGLTYKATSAQPIDFAQFGMTLDKGFGGPPALSGQNSGLDQVSRPQALPDSAVTGCRPGTEIDTSQFGLSAGA